MTVVIYEDESRFGRNMSGFDYKLKIYLTALCFGGSDLHWKGFGLVLFGLYVHQFTHICNIGHVNYRLQFIYYNTTYNIWTSTKYNIIINNTKFKGQLEVESVTTSRYMCIYINISNS
jgi:hypothetical protein